MVVVAIGSDDNYLAVDSCGRWLVAARGCHDGALAALAGMLTDWQRDYDCVFDDFYFHGSVLQIRFLVSVKPSGWL